MRKYIGKFYKRGQSQLSNPSSNAPFLSDLATQTSLSNELTTTSFPSIRDKKQTNSALCSKNSIHNYLSIKIRMTYSLVKHKENIIVSFQPLQIKIIMHNIFLPRQ